MNISLGLAFGVGLLLFAAGLLLGVGVMALCGAATRGDRALAERETRDARLDVFLAEHAMGWTRDIILPPSSRSYWKDANGLLRYWVDEWRPTRNMEHTWLVVETLSTRHGLHVANCWVDDETGHMVTISCGEHEMVCVVERDLRQAFCTAAARALGWQEARVTEPGPAPTTAGACSCG